MLGKDKEVPLPEFVFDYLMKKNACLKRKFNLYKEDLHVKNETETTLEKLYEKRTPFNIANSYRYFCNKIKNETIQIQKELAQFEFPLFLHLAKILLSQYMKKAFVAFVDDFESNFSAEEQKIIKRLVKEEINFKIPAFNIKITKFADFVLKEYFQIEDFDLLSVIILSDIRFTVVDTVENSTESEKKECERENIYISDVLQLTMYNHHNSIASMCISNSGKLFAYSQASTASVAYLGSENLVFPNKQSIINLITQAGKINSLSFSNDSCVLASGCMTGEIRIAHTEASQQIAHFNYHTLPILSVNFMPDTYNVIGASMDRTASLWSMKYPQVLRLFVGHAGPVLCTSFPRNDLFASGSLDGSIRIWDVGEGETISKIDVGKPIISIDMSSDTLDLVCGTDNGYVIAYNSEYKERWRTKTNSLVSCVKITKDSKYVVFCCEDGSFETWTMEGERLSKVVNDNISFKTLNVFDNNKVFVAGCSTRGE